MSNLLQKLFAVLFLNYFSFYSHSQSGKPCGSNEMMEKYLIEHPEMVSPVKNKENELNQYTKDFATVPEKSGQVYIIPVVFHIVHDYGPENISDAQVYDAVRILNEDFRKTNTDIKNVVSSFQSIAADAEIEFRIAQLDPAGNCTNGIDRIASIKTYTGSDFAKLNGWPRSKYLNIWVVNTITTSDDAAGYAYTPAFAEYLSSADGIMILSNYVGSIGTSTYKRGRSLTHEVGHYLNLSHTWGPSNTPGLTTNCNYDDGVDDTPNTIGWFYCSLKGTTCGTLDNVQNYMEYSYCSNMFTAGQGTRMRATLTSPIASRNKLWQTANLVATGTDGNNILCQANFSANYTDICAGQIVKFTDESYYGQNNWNWIFIGGSPRTSTEQNPFVQYNYPGNYTVLLTSGNGTSDVSTTKKYYIHVNSLGQYPPYTEGFENDSLFSNNWTVKNSYKNDGWAVNKSVAYSGNACLKLNNFNNTDGQTHELISPPIDLSVLTSVEIKFKVAFAQKDLSNKDKLSLYVSIDCGRTWALRWLNLGSSIAVASPQSTEFTPSDTTQWKEYIINNVSSTYLDDNFRFKFVFESHGGNNLFLDNINITGNYNAIPILLSPTNQSSGLIDSVTFNWKQIATVDKYQYQLDTSLVFDSPFLISNFSSSADTDFVASNLQDGKYFWKVRTLNSIDTSAWSQVWSFVVGEEIIDTTSIKDITSLSYIRIIPNPFENNGKISYHLEKLTSDTRIIVRNILGQYIAEYPVTTIQGIIELQPLPAKGMYFITLQNNTEILQILKAIQY